MRPYYVNKFSTVLFDSANVVHKTTLKVSNIIIPLHEFLERSYIFFYRKDIRANVHEDNAGTYSTQVPDNSGLQQSKAKTGSSTENGGRPEPVLRSTEAIIMKRRVSTLL